MQVTEERTEMQKVKDLSQVQLDTKTCALNHHIGQKLYDN